jgi:hypothetical protein
MTAILRNTSCLIEWSDDGFSFGAICMSGFKDHHKLGTNSSQNLSSNAVPTGQITSWSQQAGAHFDSQLRP